MSICDSTKNPEISIIECMFKLYTINRVIETIRHNVVRVKGFGEQWVHYSERYIEIGT